MGLTKMKMFLFLHLFPKAIISNCAPAGKFWTVWKFQDESGCEAWREGLTALLVVNNVFMIIILVDYCYHEHYPCQQLLTFSTIVIKVKSPQWEGQTQAKEIPADL